jgi:hypothetical protein
MNKKNNNFINKKIDSLKSSNFIDTFDKIVRENIAQTEKQKNLYNDLKIYFNIINDALKKENLNPKFLDDEINIDIKQNFNLIMEKYVFFVDLFYKQDFNSFDLNLKRYLFANYYRTSFEVSLLLYSEIYFNIINYLIKYFNEQKTLINIIKEKEDLQKKLDRLNTLSNNYQNKKFEMINLREVLCLFEKSIGNNLHNLFDIIFDYNNNEKIKGFNFRNKIAHERYSLIEINSDDILEKTTKIWLHHFAFINIFYKDAPFSEQNLSSLDFFKL